MTDYEGKFVADVMEEVNKIGPVHLSQTEHGPHATDCIYRYEAVELVLRLMMDAYFAGAVEEYREARRQSEVSA